MGYLVVAVAEGLSLSLHCSDLVDQFVDVLHGAYLLDGTAVPVGLFDEGEFCLGLGELRLQRLQLLGVVIDHVARQFVDAVDLVELVVQQKFSQNLVLPLRSVDLLSQLQTVLYVLEELQCLEFGLRSVVVQRTQLLTFSSLPFSFFLDAVLISPLALRLAEGCLLLGGALVVPWFGEDSPEGEELLDLEGRNSSAADPVFDAGHVEDDLALHVDALTRRPVADVFEEAAFDVLAVGSHHNPPALCG